MLEMEISGPKHLIWKLIKKNERERRKINKVKCRCFSCCSCLLAHTIHQLKIWIFLFFLASFKRWIIIRQSMFTNRHLIICDRSLFGCVWEQAWKNGSNFQRWKRKWLNLRQRGMLCTLKLADTYVKT
mgnify:CR=1 FL=1